MTSQLRYASLLMALAVGSLVLQDGAPVAAGSPASHEVVFLDPKAGATMSVQVDASSADLGHFSFRIAGQGTYVGRATGVKVLSPSSVRIDHEGSARFRPTGSTEFQTVAIRLQAHVDPRHHTAEATLTTADTRFHLVAREVSRAGLEESIRTFEEAINANDASALYQIVSSTIRRAYSEAAFVATWAQASADHGRVAGLRRGRVGPVETTDQGHAYVVADYEADLAGAAGVVGRFKVFFIRESEGWRLWTTVRS